MKKVSQLLVGNLSNYTIRYETIDDKEYMIVPVTMMVPGVHNGSNGPTLYTEEVLSEISNQWNGRPVVIIHPQDSNGDLISANSPEVVKERTVGYIFNAKYDNGLKAEAYISVDKIKSVSEESYTSISSGITMEVSIGAYETREEEEGEWNGEKYSAKVISLISDHLALLSGEVGACSTKDGCGIRTNSKGKEEIKIEKNRLSLFFNSMREKFQSFITNDTSDSDKRKMIEASLRNDINNSKAYIWIVDVFSDYVIYELSTDAGYKLYKRSYSIIDNKVTFGDKIDEVVAKTEYIPVSNMTGTYVAGTVPVTSYETIEKGDVELNKKEIIDYIISNGNITGYTEDNRSTLDSMTECGLGKIHAMAEKLVSNQNKEPEPVKKPEPLPVPAKEVPVVNQVQTVVNEAKKMTSEEVMVLWPEEMKLAFNAASTIGANQKSSAIDLILKVNSSFTKEELQGMGADTLKKMANALTSNMNFAGNGGGPVPDLTDNSQFVPVTEKVWADLP